MAAFTVPKWVSTSSPVGEIRNVVGKPFSSNPGSGSPPLSATGKVMASRSTNGADFGGGDILEIDADHGGAFVVLLVKRLQFRHFQQAGSAPGRPEIDDDPPAAEIGQPHRLTVHARQGKVRALRAGERAQRQQCQQQQRRPEIGPIRVAWGDGGHWGSRLRGSVGSGKSRGESPIEPRYCAPHPLGP
jgi:hypothetical protein